MTRTSDAGVSLLNVLVVVAVGAGLVQVMLSGQETALDQLERSTALAQADSLAHSGVASVAAALRRDMIDAPDTDHMSENWAQSVQQRVELDFGSFEVSVTDAQGQFNLNLLQDGAFIEQRLFASLLAALDLPEALSRQISRSISQSGPLNSKFELVGRGIAEADMVRLAPHVTAYDRLSAINMNSATEPVLAALLSNAAAARSLYARRQAKGYLERSDLVALGLTLPPLSGFTSDVFDVTARSTVGVASSTLHRRVIRDREANKVTTTTP